MGAAIFFILAASLTLFALISCGIAYTTMAQQPGSPGDASLWRTMGLVLFLIASLSSRSPAHILSSLFDQAERRAEEASAATAVPDPLLLSCHSEPPLAQNPQTPCQSHFIHLSCHSGP